MEIKRDIHLKKLIESKHNGMIKVVTGVRRCGKSYLLFNLFYRKWGAATERLGRMIGFDRVGAIARRAAYFVR